MNMFKNIFACVLLALGFGMYFTKLDDWHWAAPLGPDFIWFLDILFKLEPFSTILCVVLALTLFMVRKQY